MAFSTFGWAQSGPRTWGSIPDCDAISNPILCNGTNPAPNSTRLSLNMYTSSSRSSTQAGLSAPCYYPTNIQGAKLSAALDTNSHPSCSLPAASSSEPAMPILRGVNNTVTATEIHEPMGSGATNGSDRLSEMSVNGQLNAQVFAGPDIFAKITAAAASPYCVNGCVITDGVAVGTPETVTNPIVLHKTVTVLLNGLYTYSGAAIPDGLIQASGGSSGSAILCPSHGRRATTTTTTAANKCGLVIQPNNGSMPIIVSADVYQQPLSALSETGTTVTATTTNPNNFASGGTVILTGVAPPGYNGIYTITGIVNRKTFTFSAPSGLGTVTTLGTAVGTPPDAPSSTLEVGNLFFSVSSNVSDIIDLPTSRTTQDGNYIHDNVIIGAASGWFVNSTGAGENDVNVIERNEVSGLTSGGISSNGSVVGLEIRANQFIGLSGPAIDMTAATINLTISGNEFLSLALPSDRATIEVAGGAVIVNNDFENNNSGGLPSGGGISDIDVVGGYVDIIGNTLDGGTAGAIYDPSYGIILRIGVTSGVIIGNIGEDYYNSLLNVVSNHCKVTSFNNSWLRGNSTNAGWMPITSSRLVAREDAGGRGSGTASPAGGGVLASLEAMVHREKALVHSG